MSFIRNLLLVKKFAHRCRLPLIIFLLLAISVFLPTCTSPEKLVIPAHTFSITKEERTWLREFFQDLLFEDPGAYVLYGTRPMSWSCINKPLTDDEKAQMQAWYDALSPEEKAQCRIRDRYDFYANCKKWEKIKHRFPIKQYLFGTFSSHDENGPEFLLFINIEMALRILLEYYEDFRRVLGFDFDPLQIVFEVENRDSKFWNEVMRNGLLAGILLGFGRDNAWFFTWAMRYANDATKVGEFIRTLPSRTYEERDILHPNPQNFILPIFRSYGLYPNDQQLIKKYKKEQKQIEALNKGRDEVDVALEWLTR